jgi:predicted RecA/RadA family phage recombinase
MNTYNYPAHRIPYTNSGTVTVASGAVVVIGDMIGIVVEDIAASATGVVEIDGVHTLAATTNEAYVQGQQLYWKASTSKLIDDPTGNEKAGRAAAAKASAGTTVKIILNSNA